ncbi:MAG: sigma-70 family RNA polymerase sigma factor [Actinomycetota bacterium]|nr:sigma-70 family RNA polymerase sigma factor [Actinomycetota bacterium]
MRAPTDLTEFIASHHTRLVGVAALSTGDRQHAEDIAQETWVRLCQHWDRVQAGTDPWPYTVTIALNLCRSRWRRMRVRWREVPHHGGAHDLTVPELADDHRLEVLDDGLLQLSPRQREAIVLRYYAQLSVAETAESMRCADGTVRALTHQAITALRAHIAGADTRRAAPSPADTHHADAHHADAPQGVPHV